MLLGQLIVLWGYFLRNAVCLLGFGILSLTQVGLLAGSATWKNDGGGKWKEEKDWVPGSGLNALYPDGRNDVATFPPFILSRPAKITVDGTVSVKSIVINSEYLYSLSSGQLNVYDSILVTGKAEINSLLELENTIVISANITNPNCSREKDYCLITGEITGNGGITKQGQAKLTLSGLNSYRGLTTIQSGILEANGKNVFSPVSGVVILNTSGVVLDLNNYDNTIASLSGGGNLGGNILLGSATLTVGDDTNTVYNGSIFGEGGLVKVGIGTLTLSGPKNSFAGPIKIDNGTLRAGIMNAFPSSSSIQIANMDGAVLDLAGNNCTIPSINGGGLLGGEVKLGRAILTLSDDNDSLIDGTISGAGGIVKNGKGSLTLSRLSTYSGPTTITEGVFNLTGMINSSVTIQSGATLQGNGIIVGDVKNLGLCKPDKMVIVGNYSQCSDSTLEVNLESNESLTTTGKFIIGDNVTLNIAPPSTFTSGSSYEIVSAGDGIVGSFATMKFPDKYKIIVSAHNIMIELK